MFRTFLWYFTIALILVITLPIWFIARVFPGKNPQKWPQLILDIFSPVVLWIAGFKVEASGLENIPEEPALFIGNHQGLFDMVIALMKMGKLRPFLAKKETEKIPVISSWMKMIGCVFIDRGNVRSSLESLKQVEELLSQGKSIIVFPEGTRSRKHEMGEFKAGSFRPAIKANVPVVPFVIDGSYHAWEEKKKINPCTTRLSILKPIYPDELPEKTTKAMAAITQEKIKEVLK